MHHRQDGAPLIPQGLDPKVVAVYQAVGKIMSRFTAGKVPKAFKVIPNLQNWEEILFLTDPEKWSPHAVYQATRLFISNLNAKMVSTCGLVMQKISKLTWCLGAPKTHVLHQYRSTMFCSQIFRSQCHQCRSRLLRRLYHDPLTVYAVGRMYAARTSIA